MTSLAAIRNPFLGFCFALLILTQSLFAVGLPAPYAAAKDNHSEKIEVKQQVSSEGSYIGVATQITLATFLFYWMAKAFALLDAPIIKYRNCKAFFVNPSSFNAYYTFTSALAP